MTHKYTKILVLACGLWASSYLQGYSQSNATVVTTSDSTIARDSTKEPTINSPFRSINKAETTGFVSSLDAAEIQQYDHTIWLNDVLAGRVPGLLGSDHIRGLGRGIGIESISGNPYTGAPAIVVDGLPRDIGMMRLSEVESITVLKDAHSAVLYGSDAVNGVIMIKTKRGTAFKKQSDFSFNYGLSTPTALPEYLDAAQYMTYFNQARENDGLSPQYSDETIAHYRNGNKYRYPDVDYYSDQYLKSTKNYFDLNGQFSGGNDVAKYYANLGWNSAGSLLGFGEGAHARNNQFNVRGNVDLKINDWITTAVDVAGYFADNKRQRGNYWQDAATLRPNEYTPLLPISLISPGNKLLAARKNDIDGLYLVGGNSNYITTPIGDGYSGGVSEAIARKFAFDNRIDVNLDRITKGLSFHTNVSFNYYAAYNQTVANSYSVYEPVWSEEGDSIVDLKQYGKDSHPGTQSVGGTYFRRRFGAYAQLHYDRYFNDRNHLTGSLLGYITNFKEQGDFQGIKQAHAGLQLAYTYDRRYVFDFSGIYLNSVKLASGHKGGFSPTLGLGWIISSEDFLSGSAKVNFLKLHLSAGILNSDFPITGFFYYDNRYGGSGSYNWNEGVRSRSGVASSWTSNPNLDYAKRKDINLGLEGVFFNHTFGAEVNAFYDRYDGLVTRPATEYPGFYSDFIPYENFGANVYKGGEVALSFNKSFGQFDILIRGNLLYTTSERTIVDEVYENKYQYRAGKYADANFGLQALGLFQSDEEIANSPVQTFGTTKPGDIKYKDQNNDGIIDDNDEVYIGRYQAPWSGGLQLRLRYKCVALFVLGTGQSGSVGFKNNNYYWVDGNKKYSDVVLGSWTPESKATATYPRLSSQSSNNNFRQSTYWMYSDNYFTIRRIQLTFAMPHSLQQTLLMSDLHLFVDATNMWQFSKSRKIRELSIGGEPQYRTFSIGLNASF